MPAGFEVPGWNLAKKPDLWLPLDRSKDLNGRFLGVLGRRLRCSVSPLTNDHDGARPLMALLSGVVTLVLLVACANVANMSLARTTVRMREMGIRAAVGAGRARLLAQILVENALMAAMSGVAALLLVQGLMALLRQAKPSLLPRVEELALDWKVFAFASTVSVIAGLAAGLLPALRGARPGITAMLGASSERAGDSRSAIESRETLIAVQTMLSVMLLAGAGLLGRSLLALSDVDLGFDARNTLTFRVAASERWSRNQISRFFTEARERIRAIPQIEGVAYTDFGAPLEGTGSLELSAAGSRISPGNPTPALFRHVSPGYFGALGIPLIAGGDFTESHLRSWRGEVVVNETFVRRHWPGQDGIGNRIYPAGSPAEALRVIGVVKDVREYDRTAPPPQEIYFPNPGTPMETMFAVRTAGEPAAAMAAVRAAVASASPEIAVYQPRRLTDAVAADIAPQRFLATVVAGLAGAAAVLAVIGLYGVVSYAANRRAREIAIRLALGASRSTVLRTIGGRHLAAAGAGIVGGLLGSALSGGMARRFLFETEPTDPRTLAGVAGMLMTAAGAAAWFSIRRTLKMDPMNLLKRD